WSPRMVKAALMSGAEDLGEDAFTQGAGRLDALRAVAPSGLVLPGALFLGVVGPAERVTRHDTVTLVNPGTAPRSYTFSIGNSPAGVSVRFSPQSVSLSAGDSARVVITFEIDGALMPDRLEYPFAHDGAILVSSAGERVRAPFVLMKARLLALAFDVPPWYVQAD